MDPPTPTDRAGATGHPAQAIADRVTFVTRRWAHLSPSSGYDRLIEALGAQAPGPSTRRPATLIDSLLRRARGGRLDRYYTERSYRDERALIRQARSDRPPIVHFLEGESSFRDYKRACPEKKVVCTFHQPPSVLERYIACPERFAELDAAIVVGSSQRAYFEQFLPAERIHVIPVGISTTIFTPGEAGERRQDALGSAPPPVEGSGSDPNRLLFVGVWLRDFITTRRIMEQFARTDPQIQLDVVTLPKFAGHFLGLKNVRMHCGISEEELIRLYRNAAVLLLPLTDTTCNNALGEAIACGLPVVTSDVGSVRDYLNDDCALLLPTRDVDRHAEAVRSVLNTPEHRESMARAARCRAEALDWGRVAPTVLELYRQLIPSKRPGAQT